MIGRNMMKSFERAIPVYAGVAAVFMGLAVPGPVRANVTTGTVMTTDSAAMKSLPDYLVNSSTHLPGEVVAMVRRGELSKAIERLEKEKIVHSSTPKIKAYEWEAHRLKALGLIDKIINEPLGGAHRDPLGMAGMLKRALADSLRQFQGMSHKELLERRFERLMTYGKFKEAGAK